MPELYELEPVLFEVADCWIERADSGTYIWHREGDDKTLLAYIAYDSTKAYIRKVGE